MNKRFVIVFVFTVLLGNISIAQLGKSIHQEEYEYHKSKGYTPLDYEMINKSSLVPKQITLSNCTLNKTVFGWHPYWVNGLEANYQWSLLSDLSYFGYSVNPANGQAISTHDWATAAVVDSALANGVRVNLCVTLFNDHAVFFNSSASQQTLINNLITLIQQRNAHGVNIDFELVPSSQKTALTNFVISLSTQLKTAIPNAHISIALPAVDWSGTFDVLAMQPHIDLFLIMGYDYYYGGSTNAGPTDPLYTHISSYDRNISRSITYYLNEGIFSSKLALGLPYYGREWETVGNTVPSATTGNFNSSRTYKAVRDNIGGYYSNPVYDNKTMSTYHVFQVGSAWRQCFINNKYTLGKRYDMVNQRQLAGIGIWALGYDDGYSDLWELIEEKFTNCTTIPCFETVYDLGGPQGNYYNNENLTYTIAPSGASKVDLTFVNFSLASTDTLKLFNGLSVNDPLIGAYTGNNSPGFVSTGNNALTLSFKSGTSTTAAGWEAFWSCSYGDTIPPTSNFNIAGTWRNNDFTAQFIDADNVGGSGVHRKFYFVADFDGSKWKANNERGFFLEDFSSYNNQLWHIPPLGGNWSINNNSLHQSDESNTNTNIYAFLEQDLSNSYLYNFKAKIQGFGTNKRFGFHFFADSAHYTNRNNSYFIWFREASSQLEFYKVSNDVLSLVKTIDNVITLPNQWYDIKVIYDRINGEIAVYRDNVLLGTYIDPLPHITQGNYISFRTGNCQLFIDSISVFRSRTSSPTVLVGQGALNDIRYQNINPTTPAAMLKTIVTDSAGNISDVSSTLLNISWTAPADISWVNDGLGADIDTSFSSTILSANWSTSLDTISGIESYWYAIGTQPNDSNVVSWTNNGLNLSVSHSGISLTHNTIYYFTVRAKNAAGLYSLSNHSDGQIVIINPTVMADFLWSTDSLCSGSSVSFSNISVNATHVEWFFQGGSPASSTDNNPTVVYDTTGAWQVMLVAHNSGVSDTLDLQMFINVYQNATASFTLQQDTVFLPNAFIGLMNNSSNVLYYNWSFGDGHTSSDSNPWHLYSQEGIYEIMLIASNKFCVDTAIQTVNVMFYSGINNNLFTDGFSIYPNPFIGDLSVDFYLYDNDEISFSVINILGKTVYHIPETIYYKGKNSVNLLKNQILKSGVYFLRISSTDYSKTIKLIKNN